MVRMAVIGGSGLYSLLEGAREVEGGNEYGKPSSPISVGMINGIEVAFLARHGTGHTIPPHRVPYKANIEALAELGVERIVSTNAVGSLNAAYRPGELALLDQFINATHGRDDTFFHGPRVTHVSLADPYCSELRRVAQNRGIEHESGTVVVVDGPRFSTRAESRRYSSYADMINMTQYPEAALAREKGICYLGIAMVTDYDAGLEGRQDVKPVSYDEVGRMFSSNIERLKSLISDIIKDVPEGRSCACKDALKGAEVKA
jgi:5'-methylthioadenosine phosphorylase